MFNVLKSIDILADEEAPIHRINMNGKTVYKSALGGWCTLMIGLSFILVLIKECEEVIKKSYPEI